MSSEQKKQMIFLHQSLISMAIMFVPSLSLAPDTLNQGESLNTSSFLVSGNNFTLGFQRLGTEEFNRSYLGIWLYGDPTNPFWIGNRDKPIADNSGMLSVDGSGALKLNYSGGDLIKFYSPGRSSSKSNLTAILEETGNLVLKDPRSGQALWQSFNYATDSLLPGLKLGTDHRTGKSWTLVSWLSDSDPSFGAFALEWNSTVQKLVVNRRGMTFWTATPSKITEGPDFRYSIISNASEDSFVYLGSPGQRKFTMWRLQPNGSIVDLNSGLFVFNSAKCDGNSTENGCKRWEGPGCRKSGDRFELRSGYFMVNSGIENVGDGDDNSSLSISDCKDMCWKNCSCAGTQSFDTGCEFFHGNFTQDLSGSSIKYHVIIRHEPHNSANRNWIWILAAVAFALIVVLLAFLLYLRRKKITKKRLLNELLRMESKEEGDGIQNDTSDGHNLTFYSVTTIMTVTNNFAPGNKLGQGGFGPVYKGKLQEGKEIAVKRLSRSSGQGMIEFKNELILIAKLQHTNLVQLIGCCIHGEEKMLVYEYMPNKSLDWFIFDESNKTMLDWNKRLEIIEGIAQGILYLHKYSRLKIIHRDLKAGNILLDDNLNPKISDFGMARIFKTNAIEANTNRVVGTYGYMSPEYAMEGVFSVKSDVFSFGVLMLEIISGRKSHGIIYVDGPVNLVGYAWELWRQGNALELMDPALVDSCSKEQVLRCIQVGLLCVEHKARDRPVMDDVISMLSCEASQLPSPKQPAFTNPRDIVEVQSSIINPADISANEMTMSTMEAR